jgi:dCTP deaminase
VFGEFKVVIIGENLQALMRQYGVVDSDSCYDIFSLSLHLDPQIVIVEPKSENPDAVTYGESIPASWIKEQKMPANGYSIASKGCLLGCSSEKVTIPDGYFGMIQTKGSLARLFVQVQCCDGQIEPGYTGKVTFEICNHAPFPVRLKPGNPVAQLFIFKTSTKGVPPYQGRYQGAEKPTIQQAFGLPVT